MEIEVREHIKTDRGYIFYNLSSKQVSELKLLNAQFGNITKHSKNIIDLIEVGDFVNGKKIIEISKQENKVYLHTKHLPIEYIDCTKDKIKTILTHEQYEQNCFRLE